MRSQSAVDLSIGTPTSRQSRVWAPTLGFGSPAEVLDDLAKIRILPLPLPLTTSAFSPISTVEICTLLSCMLLPLVSMRSIFSFRNGLATQFSSRLNSCRPCLYPRPRYLHDMPTGDNVTQSQPRQTIYRAQALWRRMRVQHHCPPHVELWGLTGYLPPRPSSPASTISAVFQRSNSTVRPAHPHR